MTTETDKQSSNHTNDKSILLTSHQITLINRSIPELRNQVEYLNLKVLSKKGKKLKSEKTQNGKR